VHILVVDDTPIVLLTTERMLKKAGYQVMSACGGLEAIEIVKNQHFDLVLMDVVMGDMNGPDAARRIRLMRPETTIVFMTGFSEHLDMLDACREVVIRKPFTSDGLIRILGGVLGRTASGAAG
jgi:two-component system alkaline phosphatase synthesis response regulator PhoP